MFVRNNTPFRAALARGRITETASIGVVNVFTSYRAAGGALMPCEPPPPVATDPPDLSRQTLWSGTSVTAAGDVYGPPAPPFQRTVSLSVGRVSRRLLISGDRRWLPALAGGLQPSAPVRFDRIALSWSRAFGGKIDLPPGLFPGTDLPYPGGSIPYTSNEGGIGFYLDAGSAAGRPLPGVELLEQAVRRWEDRPVPGGFVPCPELNALRMDEIAEHDPRTPRGMFRRMQRLQHHAPGYLVFDQVPPGTPIQLEGVGAAPVRFTVSPPPARVRLRRAGRLDETRVELRSVHLDADRGTIACVHGYSFLYQEPDAPSWILVDT